MVQATAAVLWQGQKSVSVETVEIEAPRPGEVLVKIVATGVCHTDMVMRDQLLPTPQPVVLGHEGAGIVEKVGAGVDHLKPGDAVVISFNNCGTCLSCREREPAYCQEFFPRNFFATRTDGSTSISKDGTAIHSNVFGQSSFANYALSHTQNTVKVDTDVPLELLGPLGCGFQTGAGAILNALKVKKGRSLAIFGTGAVGLTAVMAAKIASANEIIAIDLNRERLDLALELGATHAINAGDGDTAAKILEICPGGIDYTMDTSAHIPVVQTAIEVLAPRGVCGLVGAFKLEDTLQLNATHLLSGGRSVRGIVEGDADPHSFIPQLIQYYRQGQFPIDRLTSFFDLENINEAIAAGESGSVVKPIVRMPT